MDLDRHAGYLEQHFDPELKLPKVANREELERNEVDRLCRSLAVILVAGSIPRRIGAEAEAEDLARDKKRARRAAFALRQSLRGWTKKQISLPNSDEIRREGATLEWDRWLEVHTTELGNRLRIISSWAVMHDEGRWGRSCVVRLENELRWVTYALRD